MTRTPRNDAFIDGWSFVHLATGVALGWLMDPFWALLLMIAWEPLEIYVISPFAWKAFGIDFGHETLSNSWSDIMFDTAGVAVGAFLLGRWLEPPFTLFG